MNSPAKSLDEVFERTGLAAKWEAKAIETTARNALAKGYPLETIHDITGLDIEKIKNIQAQQNSDYA